MFQLIRFILFFTFLFFSMYFAWANTGIGLSEEEYIKASDKNISTEIRSLGFNRNFGNVVGIEPYLTVFDYSSPERLYRKLESYLKKAKSAGYLRSNTLVVFPEHIGTLLFIMNEKKSVYYEKEWEEARNILIYSNFYKFIWNFFASEWGKEKSFRAIYLMKAEKVKNAYVEIFSKLSNFYKVNILAGSIILPGPEIKDKQIEISGAEMKNVGFLFNNQGFIENYLLQKKALSNYEESILKSEEVSNKTIKLPGLSFSFSVLFSKDSIYNSSYGDDIKNADIIISPSFLFPDEKILWQEPAISDTFKNERSLFSESDKKLSNMELWKKFSVQGKFNYINNRAYIQLFLKGDFLGTKPLGITSGSLRYNSIEVFNENTESSILN
ncbi:MAG: hypothetical protein KDK36_10290, partial [Leptospiraceae bacterium]|nr:hypothetical protein [Leptospiraceae bacterium]